MSTQSGGESPGIGGLNSYQEIANLEHRFIELLDQRDTVAMAALFRHGTFELNHAPSVVSAWGVRAGQPGHFRGLGRHFAELARSDGKWLFKRLTIHADVDYPYPAN
ncbi:hypothetical protein [Mycobacterium sp. MS1601]|uniref:hypothetical protein n=1 Tax=Mycobacterium sp. MS1601 TaxID=1936029 RepID=UPI0012FBA7FB|nr:hypothetical protein [Mycobacterium sp. MS1601]